MIDKFSITCVSEINQVAENNYEGIVFTSGSTPVQRQGRATASMAEKIPD